MMILVIKVCVIPRGWSIWIAITIALPTRGADIGVNVHAAEIGRWPKKTATLCLIGGCDLLLYLG